MPIRDDSYQQLSGILEHTEYASSSSGPWKKWSGPNYRTHVIDRRWRDVPTATGTVGGTHIYPTDYGCLRFACSVEGYSYVYRISGHNRWYRKRSDSASNFLTVVPNLSNYGTQSAVSIPREPIISASVESEALSQARARVLNAAELQLGQTFGEMRESIKFAADLIILGLETVKALKSRSRSDISASRLRYTKRQRRLRQDGLRKSYLDDRNIKRRVKSYRSSSDKVASYWLSYQYGLKPLMNDIYQMLETIENGIKQEVPGVSVKVRRKDNPYPKPTLWSGYEAWKENWENERGVEVSYAFKISNPFLYTLSQYGITNPLELAWDLVPLSFAVDWFTGAGAFIRSLTHPVGTHFRSGYKTTWTKWTYDAIIKQSSHEFHFGNMPSYTATMNNWHRVPLLSFTGHPPYIRISDLDASRTASLVALLVAVGKPD